MTSSSTRTRKRRRTRQIKRVDIKNFILLSRFEMVVLLVDIATSWWNGFARTRSGACRSYSVRAHKGLQFLYASTHLFYRVCTSFPSIGLSVSLSIGPSVCPSVCWSVHPTFYFLAEFNWKWHRNHGITIKVES